MKCARCGNEDPAFFGYDRGQYYCRKCIGFTRLDAGMKPVTPVLKVPQWKGTVHMDFDLTPAQQAASDQLLACLRSGRSAFCFAAAGAGKTEITFASIDWFLKHKKKVAFAISRRQVVLEIAARLRQAFTGLDIVEVCQDHTDITDGDLIVCTTHQLYRYPGCFDLLIMDELDAYPFAGNDVLQNMADLSCKGVQLLLSATPDPTHLAAIEKGELACVQLFKRPHGHPIPVPRIYRVPLFMQYILMFYFVHRWKPRQVLVFVPRKADGRLCARLLGCPCIDSTTPDKDALMDRFRAGKFQVLVSTTLLERGITVPGVQVLVVKGDHSVFTTASLVQIFGRAGRSFKDPEGECVCLTSAKSQSLSECVDILRKMNASA